MTAEFPLCSALDVNWMIELTRLNNAEFFLNSQLIKFMESRPDTIITLLSDEKVVVRESTEEVIDRVIDYERRLRVFER